MHGANDAIQVKQVNNHFVIKIDKTRLVRKSKQYNVVLKLKDDTGVKNLGDIKIAIDVKHVDKLQEKAEAEAAKEATALKEAKKAAKRAKK